MIEIKAVSKKIDDIVVFSNLSFEIQDKGTTAIIGKNGCGKTLISRMITGVYGIDSGCILIDGYKSYENFKAKSQFVYLPEIPYIQKGMTLDKLATRYKNVYSFDKQYYETLKERFGFAGNEKLNVASAGNKELMFLIVLFSCDCKYTIIDDSLDKLSDEYRHEIMDIIKERVKDKEKAVIITTENTSFAVTEFDNVIELDKLKNIQTEEACEEEEEK